MNLIKKKQLVAKTLRVGKNRICFNSENLAEIKEAITKQDIRDLYTQGIITIKPVKGKRKIKRRKGKRGPGKIKKKINKRKEIYVKITRKLRSYLKKLKEYDKINNDLYLDIRKKIKMRVFKSKANLKEYLENKDVDLKSEVKKPEKKSKKKRIIKKKDEVKKKAGRKKDEKKKGKSKEKKEK